MLEFSQHQELSEGLHLLSEKEIVLGKGKNYGQICFLVGGAGSGKGYAKTHFLQGSKFKSRDVDEWKKCFLRIAALKNQYPELKSLDLRVPDDVTKLHLWVRDRKIKDKTLNLLLTNAKKGTLPNILFDITYKDKGDILEILPALHDAGYDPKDIHIVWVLTNYHIAVKQNKSRERIVRDDIMLDTHSGASINMFNLIKNGTPRGIDGSVHTILGGAKHTVFYTDQQGNPLDGSNKNKQTVIKDFKYLTLKVPGKTMTSDTGLKDQVYKWIIDNVPQNFGKSAYNNKGIFDQPRQKGMYEDASKIDGVTFPTIYCDMDQVLCNFLKGAEKALGRSYTDKEYWNSPQSKDKKQELTKNHPNLYRDLEWMPDGQRLWKFISEFNPRILSAAPTEWMPNAKKDKYTWLKKNTRVKENNINIVARKDKKKYAIDERGQPAILIDDHPKNIKEWKAAGGIGIHHTSASNTIAQLKKMGFK